MNKLLKKIATWYNLSNDYKYQIGFQLDVVCSVIINLFGLALLIAPIVFGIRIINNSTSEQLASFFKLDIICLSFMIIIPMLSIISSTFFRHNKLPIGNALFMFGLGSCGFGLAIALISFCYYILEINYKFIFNPSKNMEALVWDAAIAVVFGLFYLIKHEDKVEKKVHKVLERMFTKYNP